MGGGGGPPPAAPVLRQIWGFLTTSPSIFIIIFFLTPFLRGFLGHFQWFFGGGRGFLFRAFLRFEASLSVKDSFSLELFGFFFSPFHPFLQIFIFKKNLKIFSFSLFILFLFLQISFSCFQGFLLLLGSFEGRRIFLRCCFGAGVFLGVFVGFFLAFFGFLPLF